MGNYLPDLNYYRGNSKNTAKSYKIMHIIININLKTG